MNPNLKAILQAERLPSPPGVAVQLLKLMEDEGVEMSAIAKVISSDPALSAKLIRYCNSPILARPRSTSSLDQAVVAIGMRAVKMISLSFSLIDSLSADGVGFDFKQFWNQSLATAIAARNLATHIRGERDMAFLAGLMLNIGQLAMAHVLSVSYNQILDECHRDGKPIAQAEKDRFGLSHEEVTAPLLRKWKFAEPLVECVESCLNGDQAVSDAPYGLSDVLRVAQNLSMLLFAEDPHPARLEQVKTSAQSCFDLDDAKFESLFNDSVSEWSSYAKLFEFDDSNAKTFAELREQTHQRIIETSLELKAEMDRIQEENRKLHSNAYVDALTGVKNRRAYDELAPDELENCRQVARPFVMMVIDIDFFKSINDRFGHATGDAALVRVANTLVDHKGPYDSVFRRGGEEFVVISADCKPAQARAKAEQIRQAIEALEVTCDHHTVKMTISIGVSCCAGSTRSLEEIFRKADRSLYEAKFTGRNRCCFSLTDAPAASDQARASV